MKPFVAYFNLRLGAGRSIGYSQLRDIWGRASGNAEVSLRRTSIGASEADPACVYTLCGPRELVGLGAIEAQLRQLLPEALVGPTMKLTRLF